MNAVRFWPSWLICSTALLFAGCHVPSADISTLQDPQHALNRQSKIGFPEGQTLPSLSARLASELAQKQMSLLGFKIVPPDQADFLAHADETPRDITVAEDPGGPSVGTGVGGGSGGLFTGIGIGIPLGSPQTEVIHRTELSISMETTQNPKLTVWQGKILAEADDAKKYHESFYRALLSRVGSTFNGTIRLDKEEEVAPKP